MAEQATGTDSAQFPRFTAKGVWRGCIEIAPIAVFIIPFGIAFGVAASAKGIAPEVSILMSVAIYAGASQFALLDLWYAPLPLATLALTVLAVNARHILLGAALAPWLLQIPIMGRLAALIGLSDGSFAYAVSARARGEIDAGILFGSGLAMWLIWIASTALGALAGSFSRRSIALRLRCRDGDVFRGRRRRPVAGGQRPVSVARGRGGRRDRDACPAAGLAHHRGRPGRRDRRNLAPWLIRLRRLSPSCC